MNEQQLQQVKAQLPEGERIVKLYRAFKGDLRVITENAHGRQTRYTVRLDADGSATIYEF